MKCIKIKINYSASLTCSKIHYKFDESQNKIPTKTLILIVYINFQFHLCNALNYFS